MFSLWCTCGDSDNYLDCFECASYHSTSTLSNSSDHSLAVDFFIWYCKIKQKAWKSSGDPCSIIWLVLWLWFFHLHVDSDEEGDSDDEAGGGLADEFDAEDSSDDDDDVGDEVGIDQTLLSKLEQMLR